MKHLDRIYNEDCMKGMKDIPDKSIDLILCDPPYQTTANDWDIALPLADMWREYERIIKDDGNIVLFGTGLFAFKLALSNEKLFRYDMVWKKSKCGSPLTAHYMPMKKHELILVFGKSGAKYHAQMEEGKPYTRHFTEHKMNNMKFGIKGVEHENEGVRYPSTVLDFPQKWRRQDQVHPTQKPVPLFEWLVNAYTEKGDVVLDNCIGSGTTALACIRTERHYIGFETSAEYCRVAERRIIALRKNGVQMEML